jgi:DNA-directed RNA polymerase specialized sigma subunit
MTRHPKKIESFDNSFYVLANEIAAAIARNRAELSEEVKKLNFTEGQKLQVEELVNAERRFKETILQYRQANEIYKKFLQKVCITNHNILSARPYFRESAITFSKNITPAIKTDNIAVLQTFNINYQLIKFIKDSWLGPFPKKAEKLFQRVHLARTTLIQNNMPLAVNRAKLFYRKVPKSHLTLMDLIGICGAGISAGIDKFCGEYTPVFRSVLIGRAVGNMIDSYSETTIHFFPNDKRILYKAHTIRARQGIEDITELARAVNESFAQDERDGITIPKKNITVSELASLLSAASTLSADSTVDEEGYGVYSYTEDANQDTEGSYLHRETTNRMLTLAKGLPIIYRKVLRLKGVRL